MIKLTGLNREEVVNGRRKVRSEPKRNYTSFSRLPTWVILAEEMPSGYAESLMAASPAWSLIVVIVVGVVLSVMISNVTAKLFKIDR